MFWSISNFDWRQQCRRETTADNIQQDPGSLNGRHPGRSVYGDEALDLASRLAAAADASRVDLSDLRRRARRPWQRYHHSRLARGSTGLRGLV